MPSVTYHNQPAINKTRGRVVEAGNHHPYRVFKLLWPSQVSSVISEHLISPSLHICCGLSKLGDVRVDSEIRLEPDIVADGAKLPFDLDSFASVLVDPPYNGDFQWNHDLLTELSRVARKRIIFQHWFIPATPNGAYKKCRQFRLSILYAWQPKTYFGRAQLISIFDRMEW